MATAFNEPGLLPADLNTGRKSCKHVYEIRYRRRWPVLTCVHCDKEVR